MKKVVVVVLIVLLLMALAYSVRAQAAIDSTRMLTMMGFYNPISQKFCTYPLRSVPSICETIDRDVLPADIPVCAYNGGPVVPNCDVVQIQVVATWEYAKW